jgi:hypothetical protein
MELIILALAAFFTTGLVSMLFHACFSRQFRLLGVYSYKFALLSRKHRSGP